MGDGSPAAKDCYDPKSGENTTGYGAPEGAVPPECEDLSIPGEAGIEVVNKCKPRGTQGTESKDFAPESSRCEGGCGYYNLDPNNACHRVESQPISGSCNDPT
ncbi:MAG: hypothetical protein KDD70_16845 [Bdellovibrionales bacterium]|nr:hypothetical protein [Bdellovibrionales bacterium]